MVRPFRGVSLSILLLLSVLSGAAVYAQTGQGILTGSVVDSTGALIPGVTVLVRNQKTGFTCNAVTNSETGARDRVRSPDTVVRGLRSTRQPHRGF
jgi:hypothetical protein